ncbi:hypothetical protein PTKIN_Ptkin01aG0103700 [Pterospermum kingtungense]
MLFFRALEGDSREVARILECYGHASGQFVNMSKSGIMFSSNVPDMIRQRVQAILGINQSLEDDIYLVSFLKGTEFMFSTFWWGGTTSKRKIRWKEGISLCCSKFDGGIGFKDLHSFNLALLAQQCWRLLQKPSSLGKEVVLKGGRWRVDDGCSSDVWCNKWIKKEPDHRVTPPQAQPTPLKVNSLISADCA